MAFSSSSLAGNAKSVSLEVRQYEVPAALSRLESGIELAQSLTTDLMNRLETALVPASEDLKAAVSARPGASSPLADRIEADADRLSLLNDRLADLLARLEL